ncbi:helix-turn-helix domain-containing protein [Halorubellus sp. PRR65]|uniref:ArsR/SmtB family transcription factor n=1 Tax=Halorubellus sp. PRR65 TaxID=3098148 RepID=UPI002B25E80D|nr:helix-turn-helix domain-containing protein [Halorubellus sp. PRR65]
MSELLPQEPPTDPGEHDPEVVGLEETDTSAVFSALSSRTARSILSRLYEAPATPSALADTVDTSLQNVSYHLENMSDADLVTVVDQRYSEKGNEMDVYAPSNGPLVVVGGDAAHTERTRTAIGLLELSESTSATGD